MYLMLAALLRMNYWYLLRAIIISSAHRAFSTYFNVQNSRAQKYFLKKS